MYNFLVENVDQKYKVQTESGLAVIVSLEDYRWGNRGWGNRGWGNRGWGNRGWGNRGWGNRGFAIQEPNGISIYICSEREPNEEFRQYYK